MKKPSATGQQDLPHFPSTAPNSQTRRTISEAGTYLL